MNNIQWHIDSIERSLAEIKRMQDDNSKKVIDRGEYLTAREFGSRCSCSRGTIIRMIDAGIIEAHLTVGGHRRISVDQINKVLKRKLSSGCM